METGNIKTVSIVEEMTSAYLDYSMSVIVSRALPDVRDGLKPVHRRVLYAMDQMGLQSTKAFRKRAGRGRRAASKMFLCVFCEKMGNTIRLASGGIAARSRHGAG